MQLILRGLSRIKNVKALLSIVPDKLMSFKYILKKRRKPLSFDESEISLI